MPAISVIIPTCNRAESLKRLLEALRGQLEPPEFEVIVVADGCTDDTVGVVERFVAPFTLRVVAIANGGPATARNAGAAWAAGQLLVFLDDDVVPTPRLLAAHWQAHIPPGERAVVGPYPPGPVESGFLTMHVRSWWRETFEAMCRPGHRFTYRDLLTGNLSIPRHTFIRLGGFEPALRAHEDYEFGIRVLDAGLRIAVARQALAWHHETITLERLLRRKREEGRADVLLARRHPAIARILPFLQPSSRTRAERAACRLARELPGFSERWAARAVPLLHHAERLRLRRQWERLLGTLQAYWYWRGVWDCVGSVGGLQRLLRGVRAAPRPPHAEIDLDVSTGIDSAVRRLEAAGAAGAWLRYGSQSIGRIPAQAGAEPLRGPHLRAVLATDMAAPLLKAMAAAGALSTDADPVLLANRIAKRAPWLGKARAGRMWAEQSFQWTEHATDPPRVGAKSDARARTARAGASPRTDVGPATSPALPSAAGDGRVP